MHWSANICRICGEVSDSCHLIFIKEPDRDTEEKIKKYLKLELFKDDFKPKQICDTCMLKLEDFCQFVNLCHTTDQKFDSILRQEWSGHGIIDYTTQKMSVIVTPKPLMEQLDCTDIDLYKESVLPLENMQVPPCTINDHEMLEIVENASYTTLSDNLDYLAPHSYGGKKLHSDFYQESTTVLRHSSSYQQQENSCSSNIVLNYSCQQSLPKDLHEPTQVLYKESDVQVQSEFSNLNYPSLEPSNVGLDYSNYTARDVVGGSQPAQEEIIQVQKPKPTATSTFSCPHCDNKFKRRVTLNSHIGAIHTKMRPYVCDICKKSYAIKCDLTNHRKVHTDINKCKYCPSTFSVPSKLARHLRTHTKDKPFACDHEGCGKSFSDKRNLVGHKMAVHSIEYSFKCKECERVFKTRNRLKQHGKAHTASVPFVCDICSKAYKYRCSLVSHIKKHN